MLLTIISSLTLPFCSLALSDQERLAGEPGDDYSGGGNSGPVSQRPSNLGFSKAFANNRLILSPTYSERTGFSLGASYATPFTDHTAFVLLLAGGADKKELLINAGFDLTESQCLIATFGQLRQDIDFSFHSGSEAAEMTQNSGALSYQFYLGAGRLNAFEVNGYLADTGSAVLADKTYTVDTATLYELWKDPRRVAGGRVTGLQGRLVFTPLPGGTFKLGLGGEELEYDYLTGADTTSRPTVSAEWAQQLANDYTISVGADSMAAMDRYTIGLSSILSGGQRIGVDLASLQGRDGVPDDNQIRLLYSCGFGGKALALTANSPAAELARFQAGTAPHSPPSAKGAATSPSTWAKGLLEQVAHRPSFLPSQVVAKVDPTAAPSRLVAINKTTLPPGAGIDTATGIITAPLAVAVQGITGVTHNGGTFANSGQFSLAGNSIVITPDLIPQPVVGVTDTYVVTALNVDGGTTLITVLVSHGSVRIDSITITNGGGIIATTTTLAPDLTAPITTAAPQVSGTTATATTLSVTISENGTGYYLVQPTVAAVEAGTSFAMTANVAATPAIGGLTASTAYKIYFVAKDAANNVQAAVQSVNVTTNSPPTANDFIYGTNIDNTAKTFDWQVLSAAADADGNPLTAVVQAQGSKRTFAVAGDNVTYTSAAGQIGSDTGTLRILDGQGGSKDITVTVNNIDTLAPNAPTGGPTLAAVGGVYYANQDTFNVTITSATGGRVWINGSDSGVDIGSGGSYNYDQNVAEGDNNFSFTLKDDLGNESPALAFSVFRDTVVPAISDLTNWGAGVASGSTTVGQVPMADNNAFTGSSAVSITANNGATISGFDNTSYGANKPFNLVAPANPGPGALTVTVTYSVTDRAENVTTATLDVVVAAVALPAGYLSQGGLTWMPVTFYDTWANANAYCANTTINGQTGWRLPTHPELSALYNSGALAGSQGWTLGNTWSSTPIGDGDHYFVNLLCGGVGWGGNWDYNFVSCVR